MLQKKALFISLILWTITTPALAAGPKYAKILEVGDQAVKISYGYLDNDQYCLCGLTDLICLCRPTEESAKIATTTPVLPEDTISGPIIRSWRSRDGQKQIVVANHGGQLDLLSVDLTTLTVKTVISGFAYYNFTRYTLSPDGRYLAYYQSSKASKPGERKHKVLDLKTGKLSEFKTKVAYWDLLTEDLRLFSFSDDNKRLLYLDDRDGPNTLYLVNLPALSLKGTRLISRNYTVSDFLWIGKHEILFAANRDSSHRWTLYRYSVDSGALRRIADNISYGDMMYRKGDQVIFLTADETGSRLAVYDVVTDKVSFFGGLPAAAAATGVTRNESVSLGAGLKGVLLTPIASLKTSPIIVWLHGGPHRQASLAYHSYESYAGYDFMLDEAVRGGARVLKLEYPGSYGYGRTYAEAIKGQVGKGDVAAVLTAVKMFQQKYPNSPVYLAGVSYGGYLALRTIVEQPTLFIGVFSVNGITDWSTLLSHFDTSIFNLEFGGVLDEKNAAAFDQSALSIRVKALGRQKIALIEGEKDTTVPTKFVKDFYNLLLARGKNASYAEYAGEGHVFAKQASIEDICRRFLSFINLSASGQCVLN